jgi:hypothetical protein
VTIVGSTYHVSLVSGAGYTNNEWIVLDDGVNFVQGQIISGGGTGAIVIDLPSARTGGTPTSILAGAFVLTDFGGEFAGIPTTPGTYTFTIRATDLTSGDFIETPLTMTVAATATVTFDNTVSPAPTGQGGTFLPPVIIGQPYTATVSVVDGVAPFRFYDTNGALTALGFSIDANTGTVTGTIVDPSTYGGFSGYGYDLPVLVEVYAIDAVGLTAATAQAAMVFLLPNQAMQPKAAGANVGNAGVLSMNFVGAKSVTNTAGAVTVDLTSEPYIRARLATAAALPTNAYLNGTSGVGATLTGVSTGVLTVDGQAVALNDLVLAKNEAAPAHNGAYKCTVAGAIGVAYVLTRDVAMDEAGEFTGTLVTTGPDGSANSDIVFECTAVSPVVVGTTAITFQSVGMASGFLRSANNLSDVASAIASIDNISKISTAITAGATTDLTTATGDTVSITSGATITSFGNGAAGIRRVVTFAGVSTLVHNPSQLDLITQANITTVIGDKCEMVAVGSNQWVMAWYQRYDGTPLVGGGGTGADFLVHTLGGGTI